MKRTVRRPWAAIVAALLLAAVAVAQTDPIGALYAVLRGRTGGQVLNGGRNAAEDLTLNGTSHATPGSVIIGSGDLQVSTVNERTSGGVTIENVLLDDDQVTITDGFIRMLTTGSPNMALRGTGVQVNDSINTSFDFTNAGAGDLELKENGNRVLTTATTGLGTVTSVSVATANGLAGSVASSTTTPAITLSTTVTGVLKGNGTAISAAAAGTDYYAPGGTDVAVADGGTGASTASGARTNLGLVIGTDVEAHDADLTALAGLTRTRGDVPVGGASAWIRLPLGSSGQVLKSDGTDVLWGSPGAGSGGAVTLIGSVTVSGAAVTSIQFAGLTALTLGETWMLNFQLYNPLGGTTNYYLEFNGDTTATNYYRQALTVGGTSVVGNRQNIPGFFDALAGTRPVCSLIIMRDVEGRTRVLTQTNRGAAATLEWQGLAMVWNTTNNPTSIEIVSQTASGIGIGSEFRLYKVAGASFLFIPIFPMPFRRRRYGARARTLVRGLGVFLLAGCASAQTPSPTPCVPQTLTRIVCVSGVCAPQQYQGCAGTEQEGIAAAAAQALLDAEATQAAADLASEVPTLRAQLVAALAQLDAEESRAVAVQGEASAILTAIASDPSLPAAPTVQQLRSAVLLLSGRVKTLAEHTRDAGLGAERNAQRTRRMLRALAAKLGIPVTQSQGLRQAITTPPEAPAAAEAKKEKKEKP